MHDDRSPSSRGSAHHASSGVAGSSRQVGSARGVEARHPSGRGHVGGASGCRLVPSMDGDLTPSGSKAPALRPQLAPISLAVQGAAEVKTAFWIVAIRPGKHDDDHFGLDNDYFVLATNDPSSDVGQWINERDAEQQYHLNWSEQLFSFMQRIEELKRTNSDIRNLIGSITLDWIEGTHDICLNALCNLHINQWISEAERMSPHPYWLRPNELDCFEYDNFTHTA